MATNVFQNVSSLLKEIGAFQKEAGTKQGMQDPGGAEGASSHPTAKADPNEKQPAPEGSQSADNTSTVKKQTKGVVDSVAEATTGNIPSQDDVQIGTTPAKETGKDPKNEAPGKGKPEGDKTEDGQGGTSFIADGTYGEKYSSVDWTRASDAFLTKAASDLGNEIAADIAAGVFNPATKKAGATQTHCPTCHADYHGDSCSCGYSIKNAAAQAGYQAAAVVAQPQDNEKKAAETIYGIVKGAHHRAVLTFQNLMNDRALLQKQAEEEGKENSESDPTGDAVEGEDHGSEAPAGGEDPAAAGGPPGGDAASALAAMGGEGGPGGPGGAPGGDPMAGGPPPELAGMNEAQAVQELFNALIEMGLSPDMLMAAAQQAGQGGAGGAGPGGPAGGLPPEALAAGGPPPGGEETPGMKLAKAAAAVKRYQKAGMTMITPAKQGSAQRKVRDFMKSWVNELQQRC